MKLENSLAPTALKMTRSSMVRKNDAPLLPAGVAQSDPRESDAT